MCNCTSENPHSRSWFWIPGLRQEAHPGMTTLASAPLALARRRSEQLLQTVDSLREPRPFAGERTLCAVGCLDARGLLDRARHRHRYLFSLGAQGHLLHALRHFLRLRLRLLLLLGYECRGCGAAALVLQI